MIVRDVDTKAFINTMHQSQAVVYIEEPGDTFRDVDAKASVDTLADSRESLRDTERVKGRITFSKGGRRAVRRVRHAIKGSGQDN